MNQVSYSILALAEESSAGDSHPDQHQDHPFDQYHSPLELYEARIASGELRRDAHQSTIIDDFQQLHKQLQTYSPMPAEEPSFFSKVWYDGRLYLAECDL